MKDPYILDMINENDEAYEKAKHRKKIKDLLTATAMIHALTGLDAMRLALGEGDYDDQFFED